MAFEEEPNILFLYLEEHFTDLPQCGTSLFRVGLGEVSTLYYFPLCCQSYGRIGIAGMKLYILCMLELRGKNDSSGHT